MKLYQAIGLMSGTSMDGVDAALLQTDGKFHNQSLAHVHLNYHPQFHKALKAAEFALHQYQGSLTLAEEHFFQIVLQFLRQQLNVDNVDLHLHELADYFACPPNEITLTKIIQHSTLLHAQCVNLLLQQQNLTRDAIDVIGYHGQTLFHRANLKKSIQVGNASLLAELTDIEVVYDFRQQDLMHGGEGAPLAPIYHHALAVRHQLLPCAVINCGGIANITVIPSHQTAALVAFDIGPGCGLLDRFVRLKTAGREMCDHDGKYAFKGKIHIDLIDELYQRSGGFATENFYQKPSPKSLDTHDLSLTSGILALDLNDGCATLGFFTAKLLAETVIQQSQTALLTTVVLVGGGFDNPFITQQFKSLLPATTRFLTASDLGWQSQAIEAELMAYLAIRHQQGLAITFPTTTGVIEPMCGGKRVGCQPTV
ncbi:MAG: anhydro-N-acetylmuramic acid kinase [Legionellales bacterium]|nr:anhydro-N-acetylmuramic acid kinase [Legionellales bacterium]